MASSCAAVKTTIRYLMDDERQHENGVRMHDCYDGIKVCALTALRKECDAHELSLSLAHSPPFSFLHPSTSYSSTPSRSQHLIRPIWPLRAALQDIGTPPNASLAQRLRAGPATSSPSEVISHPTTQHHFWPWCMSQATLHRAGAGDR